MLKELTVRDFAIIENLNLELGPGFVVFTGETGAGKSIIVDAVEMLLGARADTTMIRTGADQAILEGLFLLDESIKEDVLAILETEGLRDSDDMVMLGREIRLENRNICRVNGRSVNLSVLRDIGEYLVDVHGQSEHLSLLRVKEHINLLDRFAHVEGLRAGFADLFAQLQSTRSDLMRLRQQEADAARRVDLLTFQLEEIERAQLTEGEETALVEERTRLANAEDLALLAEKILAALIQGSQQESAAQDQLGLALGAIQKLSSLDPSMSETAAELEALVEQTKDTGRHIRTYLDGIAFDPQRLEEVEERLALIHDLERKYGHGIDTILNYARNAREELDGITHSEQRKNALEQEERKLLEDILVMGMELSRARMEAGTQLAGGIEKELEDLKMESARFNIAMTMQDAVDGVLVDERKVGIRSNGLDQVEFMVEPNPGEGFKPLAKIASGGETSRLMLGLKGVLASVDPTPSLIFDEIDQGIGGRVGAIVGRKLWRLSSNHQVLCITHLPQLAAFGDQHFKVEKHVADGRTVTAARELQGSARIPELALMLGGVTDTNLESAAEVLRTATQEKQQSA